MAKITESWSKEFPYLIEIGECERELKDRQDDVKLIKIKAWPERWEIIGYAKSPRDGVTEAISRKGNADIYRMVVRSTKMMMENPITREIADPHMERCEALLENAIRGLKNLEGRIRAMNGEKGQEALLKACGTVCRTATDWKKAGPKEVLFEVLGDEDAESLFWSIVEKGICM